MRRDLETPYGPLSAATFARLFPEPIVRLLDWPWARPLTVILSATRWTIDDVVSDPAAAREVRALWRVWTDARRLAAEIEWRNTVAESLWWREMGCPVPCPLCGAVERCSCTADSA